jgi:NADPH-dependent curcumin reductase CurA
MKTREIRLAARPVGEPKAADFELVDADLREMEEGEVVVRNLFMSVDPYMRMRMNDARSYTPPFAIGKALNGAAVGEVVSSRAGELKPGDIVSSQLGWREHFVAKAKWLERLVPGRAPLTAHLGILGLTGFTGWYGLKEIGRPKPGDTVFVSAAAGAVGSAVGQLAKLWGCRVIGSAGSAEKVEHLRHDLGFDAAFDYHQTPPAAALRELAPDGIDVYFDNVGGDHLEAALTASRPLARFALCGMISQYNAPDRGPRIGDLIKVVGKQLRLQGFVQAAHSDMAPAFIADMSKWIAEGKVKWRETIEEGIENAPAAFLKLFTGENIGKMLVKLG